MNTVERIKQICKERKIPISKLERDCGFSNGYIGQLRKGTVPDDRLLIISKYLNESIEYIMNGEDVQWDPTGQTMDYTISLSEEEQDLLMEYRKADDTQKEMIRRILAYSDKMQ